MISLEKWMILTPLQKLPNNEGGLGKKIAQSGHTGSDKGNVPISYKRIF